MGFSREELESYRDGTVPDLLDDEVNLLFVGINPGLWTVATQTHFSHPGNRFYPALHKAGIITRSVDRSDGFTSKDKQHILERHIGITNIAERATAKASELSKEELRTGAEQLKTLVSRIKPDVVAIAGITAYRMAFKATKAKRGLQDESLAGAELWVVPNPSGLNAHETVGSLAIAYAEPAISAGVIDKGPHTYN